jgi:hypothetical protein
VSSHANVKPIKALSRQALGKNPYFLALFLAHFKMPNYPEVILGSLVLCRIAITSVTL